MIAGEQEFRGTDEPHTILKFDIAGQEILPRQLFQLADSIFAERVSGKVEVNAQLFANEIGQDKIPAKIIDSQCRNYVANEAIADEFAQDALAGVGASLKNNEGLTTLVGHQQIADCLPKPLLERLISRCDSRHELLTNRAVSV